MKYKIIFLFFFISLFVVSCSKKEEIKSFDVLYKTLQSDIKDTFNDYSDFILQSGNFSQNFEIHLSNDDKNTYSKSKINYKIYEIDKNLKIFIEYEAIIQDKKSENIIKSNGKIEIINTTNHTYLLLNEMDIDMGTGNIENDVLSTIISKAKNKRILLDSNYDDTTKNILLPHLLINKLKPFIYCDFLDAGPKSIFDNVYGYKSILNTEKLSKCLYNSINNYSGLLFDGLLGYSASNSPYLEIKKLKLPNSDLIIKGGIQKNNISLYFDDINLNNQNKIELIKNKKSLDLSYTANFGNYNLILHKEKDKIKFNGNIKIKTTNYSENLLNFILSGDYYLQNEGLLKIIIPDNYIILSQLLGDNYSLKKTNLNTK